ncbi:MAG: histidinol dehydrogenase, partial [Deltaproteobacteria bacterium]|nr:histidinol dehydrogenase [Deltaproteobacteria bacterium]
MKRVFHWAREGFEAEVERLVRRGLADTATAEAAVRAILDDVAARGDAALVEYTERFDAMTLSAAELRVPEAELEAAWRSLPERDRECLTLAADRIRRFHEGQKSRSWFVEEEGVVLGQRVTPVDSAGLYAPGGKASYPSSVLMNAIPATVAGVGRLVLVSPTPRGETNPHVLGAAWLCGVREVYRLGGAQA